MKKKVLSAALAVCMIFGCASALPQDSFVDNISITSSAYEKEDLSWWEDVKYDVYDKKDGKERYRITGFSNQTAYSISLSGWYKDSIYSEKQFACIGEKAFNGYYHNLHSIEISPKYEVIEKDAFINSYNLTQFVIPKTVKSIGSHAIGYELDKGSYKKIGEFDKIKIICAKGSAAEKYAKDNGINYEINDDDFEYVLLDNGTYKIMDYYGDEKKLIEIPSFYRGKKVTVIEYGPDAEEVIIPDSITQIGKSAFRSSELLKKITIGKGVKEIGFETFRLCSNLKTVVFSEGLEEIGDYAFYFAGLTEINLPSTLKKIGSYSFGNCSDLKTVKLNNGIQYIGYAAFDQSGVETINFPKSITFIGGYAFFETPWLSNMQKKSSFVVVNGFLIDGKAAADAAGYIIQNDIKYVCDDAFNKSLGSINANTVRIKSGVETIGKRAFRECRNLNYLLRIVSLSNSCGKRGEHQLMIDNPYATHCGRCMPCMYRKAALVGYDDPTAYGFTMQTLFHQPRNHKINNDFYAMLNYLRTDLSDEYISKELEIMGLRKSNPHFSDYVDLVKRTRVELKYLLRNEATDDILTYAGLL